MNRQDCEKIILEKMKDIVAIYHEYNPDGNYLTLSYLDEQSQPMIMFNNRHYDEDSENPIDYWEINNG